jgi:TetR/AcrR family transcriptional regulator
LRTTTDHTGSETRQHLLLAALKSFSERGYAATSVHEIVDAARVSKPALYYHFKDKAGIFHALVDRAHDERYRLMREASERKRTVAGKLEEIVATMFDFSVRNRQLMRLGFATAFAASGEAPEQTKCREKGRRNFEFVRSIIKAGQASGELSRRFNIDELAMGIYGLLSSYVIFGLLAPECPLNRQTARQIVQLFMKGAATRQPGSNRRPA